MPHRQHFLETLADIGSGYVIAVSMLVGKDCKLVRILQENETVCRVE